MSTAVVDFPTQYSKNAVSEISERENFVNFKTSISAGSSKGDNYLGEIYRVKIDGKKKDGSTSVLSLIIKAAPQNVELREKIDLKKFFLAEIDNYLTVLPALENLQNGSRLTDNDKFKFIKCYHCSKVDFNEMLIMEDMAIYGFRMFHDRKVSLDVLHANLVVEKLAQFHALSFVMKKKDPSMFKTLAKMSKERVYSQDAKDSMKEYLNMAKEKAIGSIDKALHKEKLRNFTDDMFGHICKLMESNQDNPHFVLCHGDSWTNNFLFKYKDGKPVDVRLLDWQIVRYSSPVTDIMYLIFACTDADFRRLHYEPLLKHYYETMDKFLSSFGMKAQEVYPEKVFKDDMKKYAIFGMGMAIMTLLLFTCESEDVPDLSDLLNSDSKPDFSKGNSANLYNKRINEVVNDYINYGYM